MTPSMTVFGDRASKQVIRLLGWRPNPVSGVFIRRGRNTTSLSLPTNIQRGGHLGTQGQAAVFRPRREASPGPSPTDTLILDFHPPEL